MSWLLILPGVPLLRVLFASGTISRRSGPRRRGGLEQSSVQNYKPTTKSTNFIQLDGRDPSGRSWWMNKTEKYKQQPPHEIPSCPKKSSQFQASVFRVLKRLPPLLSERDPGFSCLSSDSGTHWHGTGPWTALVIINFEERNIVVDEGGFSSGNPHSDPRFFIIQRTEVFYITHLHRREAISGP